MAVDRRNLEHKHPAPLWTLAFRPFFLATALWAAMALAVWVLIFLTGSTLPSRFDPLTWHIHAMLFGFVPAAIAGFILTAVPNWTGRPPIQGTLLIGLVVLWLLGRIACLISAVLPLWLTAAIDIAFLVALCAVVTREVVAARNWRNVMMPFPIGVLAIANLLMYLELAQVRVPAGIGWRIALAAIIALVSAIGGRIVPAFTRNWLTAHQATRLPAAHDRIDSAALASLHTGLITWAFFPRAQLVGMILLLAAVLNFWRLVRWRGMATQREPLLAILHLGYGWLALGAALLGVSLLSYLVPEAAAIHAFTVGAISIMILAVMTRVALGHTGRPLKADRITAMIYGAITFAAVTRISASFAGRFYFTLLVISALLWITSFLGFAWKYASILVSPRIDERSGFEQN